MIFYFAAEPNKKKAFMTLSHVLEYIIVMTLALVQIVNLVKSSIAK